MTTSHQRRDPVDLLRSRDLVSEAQGDEGADTNHVALLIRADQPSLRTTDLPLLMSAAWLQRGGYQTTVVLVEAVTYTPSFFAHLATQITQLLPGVVVLNDTSWTEELSYIPFLRNVGSLFDVGQMVRDRSSCTFAEFNNQVILGYTLLHLAREYGCRLVIADRSWWSYLVRNRSLIDHLASKQVRVLRPVDPACPAIWLDPTLTSPFHYYQGWINVDDGSVQRLLRRYTFLPEERIAELTSVSGAALREAKRVLAYQATAIVHGHSQAHHAQEIAAAIFSGSPHELVEISAVPEIVISESTVAIADVCVAAGLCPSKSAARRLAQQGGLRIDDVVITDATQPFPRRPTSLLRVGKTRIVRVRQERL